MAKVLGPNTRKDPEAVLLVDVGGNTGHEAVSFREKHPEVPGRLIIQDLPSMIDAVKKQGHHQDLELVQHDFFTRQPVKGGCSALTPRSTQGQPTDFFDRCTRLLSPQHLSRLARSRSPTNPHQHRQVDGKRIL